MSDQWIVGYGSLMDRASRTRQAPRAQSAFPVKVRGISAGWFHQFKQITQSLSPTFLGAQQVDGAVCGGVIYKATQTDLNATDQRETGYTRVEVPADAISLVDRNRCGAAAGRSLLDLHLSRSVRRPSQQDVPARSVLRRLVCERCARSGAVVPGDGRLLSERVART